jgi:hypothetical protein
MSNDNVLSDAVKRKELSWHGVGAGGGGCGGSEVAAATARV